MQQRQAILQPLGLAASLAIGFGTLSAFAIGWALTRLDTRADNNVYEHIKVCADGMLLIARQAQTSGETRITYRTLDGAQAKFPEDETLGESYTWSHGMTQANVRPDRGETILRFSDLQNPANFWYFVYDSKRNGGYFVGYGSRSKRCVGFIGRDGLQPDRPPLDRWFSVEADKLDSSGFSARESYRAQDYSRSEQGEKAGFPRWKIDMISENQVLQIDLRSGKVTTLLESADLHYVGAITVATPFISKDTGSRKFDYSTKLAVRTKDRVFVFDRPEKQPVSYLLPGEARGKSIDFFELAPGKALVIFIDKKSQGSVVDRLLWFNELGNVSQQATVTLDESGHSAFGEFDAWLVSLASQAPIISALYTAIAPTEYVRTEESPNYRAAMAKALGIFWLPLLAITLLSAAMAVYCYRRHVRYCQPYAGVWFAFVLLLGLPGLIGYLYHRRWPVLEKCPACGQTAPRDREQCAKCNAAFPLPERNGCEVFA